VFCREGVVSYTETTGSVCVKGRGGSHELSSQWSFLHAQWMVQNVVHEPDTHLTQLTDLQEMIKAKDAISKLLTFGVVTKLKLMGGGLSFI
jgi:hypothetical protein